MATALQTPLRLPPLNKQNMAQLIAKANQIGVEPEDYAKRLVEDGLALQRIAEKTTIAEIMAPVRQMTRQVDDSEIVKLVGKARRDYHRGNGRTRKR